MSIFSKLSKLAALKGADRVIETRNRVAEAIEKERARLLQLVIERAKADRALVDAQTAVALSEAPDDNAARRQAEQVGVTIERQSAILSGLRSRLATQAGEIEIQHQAVKSAMPGHIERVRSEFKDEWKKAASLFSAVLGKRAELEKLIGKLELPAPAPSACELPGDVTAPWQAVAELDSAIEEIAGWARVASWPEIDSRSPGNRHYNPGAIYVVTSPASGMEPGTLVMDAVFPPGQLSHLFAIHYAELATSQDWQASLEAASQAKLRTEAAERQEREQQQHQADVARGLFTAYDPRAAAGAAAANARVPNDVVPENTAFARPVPKSDPQAAAGFNQVPANRL